MTNAIRRTRLDARLRSPKERAEVLTASYYAAVNQDPEFRQELDQLLTRLHFDLSAFVPSDDSLAALAEFAEKWRLPRVESGLGFECGIIDVWDSLREAVRRQIPPVLSTGARGEWGPSIGSSFLVEERDLLDERLRLQITERIPYIYPFVPLPFVFDVDAPAARLTAYANAIAKALRDNILEQAEGLRDEANQQGWEALPLQHRDLDLLQRLGRRLFRATRGEPYGRVSTPGQEVDGTSLVTQERACREYALSMGWTVVDSISETASGYSLDRPGMTQLRQLLKQGAVDVVVAYAVDRLSRNQNQIGVMLDEVERAGAKLDFVTENFEDTAVGRFILAARAFGAEVEREKILERTTRGKLERARSGRIPQAMGRGTYGYSYNAMTGKREREPDQAIVVGRIFGRFLEVRSYSAVSRELNDEEIPALGGGRWYPLTIRRILMNESYTGRLIFRRTQWVKTRTKQGHSRRKPVDRPPEEWIEIPNASPRIIDDWTWNRVQEILNEPSRAVPQQKRFTYLLTGRLRCSACGSSMVGRSMTVGSYHALYYVCTHAFNPTTKDRCGSRHVRLDRLEPAIWDEVGRVLADPELALRELKQQSSQCDDQTERRRLEREIASLAEREKRLVRLYTFGEIDEAFVRDEGALLKKQRQADEKRLGGLTASVSLALNDLDATALSRACAAIRDWLARATDDDRRAVLEALQISVVANRERAELHGVLPTAEPGTLFTLTRASA